MTQTDSASALASDIDTAPLEQLIGIRQEQARLDGFRDRAESLKEQVDEAVYQRVVRDYVGRRASLEERAAPLKAQAAGEYRTLCARRARTEATHEDARLVRQELQFRQAVGELDEAALTAQVREPDQTLERCRAELAALDGLKGRFVEAFGTEAELDAATQDAPASASPVSASPMSAAPANSAPVRTVRSKADSAGEPDPAAQVMPAASMAPVEVIQGEVVQGAAVVPGVSAARRGRSEAARDGVGPDGVDPDGVDRDAAGQSGAGQDGADDPDDPLADFAPSSRSASRSGAPAPVDTVYMGASSAADPVGGAAGTASDEDDVVAVLIEVTESGPVRHPLGVRTLVGRSEDNSFRLSNPSVSRQHAILTATPNGYVLQDLRSQNGTFVNAEKVETHTLRDGDQILFGDAAYTFRLSPASSLLSENAAIAAADPARAPAAPAGSASASAPGPAPEPPSDAAAASAASPSAPPEDPAPTLGAPTRTTRKRLPWR